MCFKVSCYSSGRNGNLVRGQALQKVSMPSMQDRQRSTWLYTVYNICDTQPPLKRIHFLSQIRCLDEPNALLHINQTLAPFNKVQVFV